MSRNTKQGCCILILNSREEMEVSDGILSFNYVHDIH